MKRGLREFSLSVAIPPISPLLSSVVASRRSNAHQYRKSEDAMGVSTIDEVYAGRGTPRPKRQPRREIDKNNTRVVGCGGFPATCLCPRERYGIGCVGCPFHASKSRASDDTISIWRMIIILRQTMLFLVHTSFAIAHTSPFPASTESAPPHPDYASSSPPFKTPSIAPSQVSTTVPLASGSTSSSVSCSEICSGRRRI